MSELQIKRGGEGGIKGNLKIIFSYVSVKTYLVTPHKNLLDNAVPMMDHKICFMEKFG